MTKKDVLDILIEKFDGDKALALHFFDTSIPRLKEMSNTLNNAVSKNEKKDILFYAHKLKYSSSLYKLNDIHSLTVKIENVNNENEIKEIGKTIVDELNNFISDISK